MGRHGGGSRGGGSRRSSGGGSRRSSGGGSRRSSGGGGSSRFSRTAFEGSYNRSYYDSFGRYHSCYTTDRNFGKKSGWSIGTVILLGFVTIHMFFMLFGFFSSVIVHGEIINGDRDRIFIEDRAHILTDSEERRIIRLFNDVYENSGMPITLITDDFTWRERYDSIQIYSEELYYKIDMREDAALIIFTCNDSDGFFDWEYDIYCGDDTIACFSDSEFDDVLENFQKGMAGENLADALEYSWNSVMDKIGKTDVNFAMLPVILIIIAFYGIFYMAILGRVLKQTSAYIYFKKHPEMLNDEKTEKSPPKYYAECPNCSAPNTNNERICSYCGSVLEKDS